MDAVSTSPLAEPLDAERLNRARAAFAEAGAMDGVIQELGFSDEDSFLAAIGAALRMDVVELGDIQVDASLVSQFPLRLIHRHGLFPIGRDHDELVVVLSDPFNMEAIDAAGAAVGIPVHPAIARPRDIARLVREHLGVGAETIEGMLAQADTQGDGIQLTDELDWDESEAAEMAQQASVVRLVNEILTEAVEARASDIHIESQPEGFRIRYRIDGVLIKQPAPPEIHRFRAAIISRLKIMARLNIAERRVPQDGRIKVRVAGRDVDIRMSIIPMLHGEGIVMRVLDKANMHFSLRGVGMAEDCYRKFNDLIKLPHGIILVTGPTGSGKTTTLYSALSEIQSDEIKIVTTEDPIEYQLDGINQIQVHTKVGLTFASSLRSILRHDPDVVLVGEIRDLETAENAIQASLTGHLVFSTLHTNDAAGAFMRLVDMGVEPYLVSSTVEGVMAQRLVRTLCRECRAPLDHPPSPEDLPRDFPYQELIDAGQPLFQAVGCRMCRGTGYSGRIGLFELLSVTDEIRRLASDRAPSPIVAKAARDAGMRSLREDGWLRVLSGDTTVDEVLRVTRADYA
ncbi:MAG: type II/IV secretion system protein [Pirellulales bacterium]|nr:type II/IV secretion system protein [Pirellulales bacterium]